MTWSSLYPSFSISHGNSIWRMTTAWYLEGKCIKPVSWAWRQFWVCYSSRLLWLCRLLCPAPLAWRVRDKNLPTFWWPPIPGNVAFAGGEKQFCEHTNDAKTRKKIEAIRISLSELYQNSNFWFLMSGKWKLKAGYLSMHLWYLKLLRALENIKLCPLVFFSLCLGKLTLWGSIICSDLFWSCWYTSCFAF